MKILMIFDCIFKYGGGSQHAVFLWVKNLIALGYDVRILTGSNIEALELPFPKDVFIVNKAINLGYLYQGLYLSTRVTKETQKTLLDFAPDIVHMHENSYLNSSIKHLLKASNTKFIGTFHTNVKLSRISNFFIIKLLEKTQLIGLALEAVLMRDLKKCDVITSPTKAFTTYLLEKTGKSVEVLPIPIDSAFYSAEAVEANNYHKTDKLKFITVSRLSPEKNIDILIHAFAKTPENYFLTIIGEGTEKRALMNLVEKLKLSSRITFGGWVQNQALPAELIKHDVFISASDYETYGITTLEALACKLPCILFDYATSREILPSGCGLFINSKDPSVWATELCKLTTDKNLLVQLKKQIKDSYFEIIACSEVNSTKKLVEIYKNA